MKKNQGYTLIEVIIVIAIIVILAGMSFVTLGIIKQAKATEAAETLDNQIGSLLVKTKAISDAKKNVLCMKIMYNDSDVTYSDGTYAKDGSYSIFLGYDENVTGVFSAEKSDIPEATLPDIIKIKYTSASGGSAITLGDGTNTDVVIEFNKSNGSVRYGAGTYEIVYNDNTVATVVLDETTGNHYIK